MRTNSWNTRIASACHLHIGFAFCSFDIHLDMHVSVGNGILLWCWYIFHYFCNCVYFLCTRRYHCILLEFSDFSYSLFCMALQSLYYFLLFSWSKVATFLHYVRNIPCGPAREIWNLCYLCTLSTSPWRTFQYCTVSSKSKIEKLFWSVSAEMKVHSNMWKKESRKNVNMNEKKIHLIIDSVIWCPAVFIALRCCDASHAVQLRFISLTAKIEAASAYFTGCVPGCIVIEIAV